MPYIFALFIWLLLFILSISIGRFYASPLEILNTIFQTQDTVLKDIIFNIRIPRALLSSLCGGILCLCGLILQGVFKNPLVGPQITGVSTASAFGGSICILFGLGKYHMLFFAFGFGICAILMLLFIAKFISHNDIFSLILSGIIINGFFAALISLIQYIADNEDILPNILYWLMGSFINADYDKLLIVTIIAIPSVFVLFLMKYRLNLMLLDDDDASALGVNVKMLRISILLICTLLISAQVSVSGSIGWIGLVVPHITRFIFSNDHIKTIPMSFVLGGIFMLCIDNTARSITQSEIPLGILSALIGSPIFIFLLKKSIKNAT